MVDAIGAVGSEQIKTSKKDNSINWKQCTSDEIIEYEQQGQEVPDYILQWAKEIAKLENAPEDITYEMAMGATTMVGVNANQQAEGTEGEEQEGDTNNAAAIREKLSTEGVTLKQQAKMFRGYSDQYTDEIKNMMSAMEQYMAQSEAAAADAQSTKDDVMSRIQSLIASKKQNKTGDVAAAIESARIDREIRSVGQAGLSTVETVAAPVDSTGEQISTAEFTSLTGRQFGNETVSIGSEPELNSHFFDFTGRITVKSGEKELKQSDAGDKQFSENRGTNSEHAKTVLSSEDEIRRASGASLPKDAEDTQTKDAANKAENDNTVNDSENNQVAKESDTKKQELAQQDPETVDEKITTDPNEIMKRKERKGLA